jgi:hypothetical protein
VIKSEPYYWVECDGCDRRSTYDEEFTAWGSEAAALDDIRGQEWVTTDDGRHLCEMCSTSEPPAGRLPGTGQLDLLTGKEVVVAGSSS